MNECKATASSAPVLSWRQWCSGEQADRVCLYPSPAHGPLIFGHLQMTRRILF